MSWRITGVLLSTIKRPKKKRPKFGCASCLIKNCVSPTLWTTQQNQHGFRNLLCLLRLQQARGRTRKKNHSSQAFEATRYLFHDGPSFGVHLRTEIFPFCWLSLLRHYWPSAFGSLLSQRSNRVASIIVLAKLCYYLPSLAVAFWEQR